MIVKSFAKINSILGILRKRDDGYHDIFSIMHKINLYDEIEIEKNSGGLYVETDIEELNNKGNLSYKAAELFFKKASIEPQVSIYIKKHIPIGGGLGGGSSNAAYTLRALNEMFDYPLSIDELFELASKIGSDVAFFIVDGSAIAEGKGERIEKIDCDYENHKVLLVVPDLSISTAYVYSKFKLTNPKGINKMAITVKGGCRMSTLKQHLHNDLESVVLKEFGLLKEIKEEMIKSVGNGLVSGSGSSIFSIIGAEVLRKGRELKEFFKEKGFFCEIFDFA
ncbi:4-(cytidine 5'-diphospho)-2-C-methyl-D-erythritol kinase [Hippea alviniae]|uniref:4-(cytidine 5'-diphospho)-2-C-methyl-D-erythritol kinase n=1 Tax=Hippea alviniae TaxID=1279027 RepID=UPI0003B56C5A|nr:4-(cytidine 5'-diphospho)-2-C-methyl-D-erythritol kinase [Hippea alviniae]